MWSPTRSLELLVLAATVAPAELIRVATAFGPAAKAGADRVRAVRRGLVGVPAAYLVVTAAALAVAADGGFLPDTLTGGLTGALPGALPGRLPGVLWLPAAALAGAALVGGEFAVGAVPRLAAGAGLPRLAVHRDGGAAGGGYAASVLATAVAEELLYRGLWIGVLHERLHLPAGVAVAVAAVAYAGGHLFFGGRAVAQKTLSGVVFGLLMLVSGSLAVPLVAHLAQNGAVLALGVRQERERQRDRGARAAAGREAAG
ncbi:CPBP family intramembrane glutamic endopeptidase [Streptomyces katrae]|uniref:CPBP family intramembrane glutamic endopeptidase n=1 Tax=Streptomyces katrae TaxID=68223 RepID=UPI0009A493B4|nr:CPBP family intramembrane glutamic endopeptidase [Streptomyces katrae]